MADALSSRLDAIAAATADVVSQKDQNRAKARSPRSLPFYDYRSPSGVIQRALDAWSLPRSRSQKAPRLHYLMHEREVNARVPEVLAATGTLYQTVGLDLEWEIGLRVSRTAVMQLATATDIFVIQLSKMATLPSCLVEMLQDPRIHKVGVAIQQDLCKLQRDFGVQSVGGIELSRVASALDPERWQRRRTLISLRELCMTYLERDLDKRSARISAWSRVPLTQTQLVYAASDAYVSLELLHAMVLQTLEPQQVPYTQVTYLLDEAMRTRMRSAPVTRRKGLMAHEQAWRAWANGSDLATVARERHIQLTTAATYVARALPDASIPPEQRDELYQRLRAEFLAPTVLPVTVRNASRFVRLGIFSYKDLYRMLREPS